MKRNVTRIYDLFLSIERDHPHTGFDTPLFNELLEALDSLQLEKDVELIKIYSIRFHLKKEMPLRDFSYWLLPLERYLNKNLKDEDFIIFNKDHVQDSVVELLKANPLPLILILENIRSSFNVGSIFRTAEAFNLEKIILTGYSPDPSNLKTQKTTLGSHEHISWETHPRCLDLLPRLKEDDFQIIAAETTSHAVEASSPFNFENKTAIIFGNERFGLDPQLIAACDETRKVPLLGVKNSLNVANCASIFAYEFSRQYSLVQSHKKSDRSLK